MKITDAERLDWLEARHTLHRQVDILYVVDGYQLTITHDDEPIGEPVHGESLRAAVDKMIGRESGKEE